MTDREYQPSWELFQPPIVRNISWRTDSCLRWQAAQQPFSKPLHFLFQNCSELLSHYWHPLLLQQFCSHSGVFLMSARNVVMCKRQKKKTGWEIFPFKVRVQLLTGRQKIEHSRQPRRKDDNTTVKRLFNPFWLSVLCLEKVDERNTFQSKLCH